MKKPLTEDQLAAARAQLHEANSAEDKAFTDQILFEGKRDELAYVLIQEAKQKKEPALSWGDAQALATQRLRPAAPEAPAPLVEKPAAANVVSDDSARAKKKTAPKA